MSNARELSELAGSYGTGGFVGMKNRIINGQMVIDQRNAGAALNLASSPWPVDRFQVAVTTALFSGTGTIGQSSVAPSGFTKSLLWTQTTGVTTISSSVATIVHFVEGFNFADFDFGTANAKPVTISFKARSSVVGTYCVGLRNSATDRSYVAEYSITAANTWEDKTVTILGDTSGTWLKDNGRGVIVTFDVGSGSNSNAASGSWVAGSFSRTTNQVNFVGTSGATFYITGVQIEKGSTATSFDYRPYGTELALCQRYYETSYAYGTAVGTANAGGYAASPVASNTVAVGQAYSQICFNVAKRAAPTVTVYGYQGGSAKVSVWNTGADLAASSGIPYTTSTQGFNAYNGAGATLTTTNFGVIYHWTASIEL